MRLRRGRPRRAPVVSATPGRVGAVAASGAEGASWLFSKVREAASHTMVYGFGAALQSALGFILLPLYTHYFTSAVYGVLSLIQLAAMLAGGVFFLGASSALARSYYDYADAHGRRAAVCTALWLTLAGAVAQVLVGVLFGNALSRLLFGDARQGPAIAVALAGSALTFVNQLFLLLMRFERKSAQVVALNLLALVLTTSLIWWLLAGPALGVMAPLLGGLLAQLVLTALLAWSTRRNFALVWSRVELGLQLRFGGAAVGIGLGFYALDAADRFLLNRYGSLGDVGVYSLGYRVGMVIQVLFVIPFSQIWSPMRMEYRNHADAGQLLTRVLTYFVMAGLLVTAAISLFSRELILLVGRRAEYAVAWHVVAVVMLAYLCYGLVNIVDFGLWVERKVHYEVGVFAGVLAVNAALNVLLLPRFGYLAAAGVKLLSYALVAATIFVLSHRFVAMRVERRVWVLAGSCCAVLAAGAVLTGAGWGGLAGRLALLVTLAGTWYSGVLDPLERSRLVGIVHRFTARSARG